MYAAMYTRAGSEELDLVECDFHYLEEDGREKRSYGSAAPWNKLCLLYTSGSIHFFAKHQLVKRDRIDRLVATGQDILQSIVGSCHVQFISVFFMKKHHSVILSYFLSNVPVRRQCSV